MLALASTNEEEEMLYCYGINRCDTVQFGLITTEGGAEEIADLFGLRGKAGPTFLIKPDRSIIDSLYYSKWGIIKDFKDNEIDSAECNDTIEVPAVRFTSFSMYDTLAPNSSHNLTWYSDDPDGVSAHALYFSTNEDRSWELLDSSAGHDSIYSFKVPDTYTKNGRFKLHVYDSENNMKEKISVPFTIDGATEMVAVKKRLNKLITVHKTKSGINLNWPYTEDGVLKIIDMQGRVRHSFNTVSTKENYRVEKLPKGVYLLRSKIGNGQSNVQKINLP